MEKELFGIGRGYVLAFLCVALTAILCAITLMYEPKTHTFLLGYWKDFLLFFVVPIIASKELGKIGQSFAGKNKP